MITQVKTELWLTCYAGAELIKWKSYVIAKYVNQENSTKHSLFEEQIIMAKTHHSDFHKGHL